MQTGSYSIPAPVTPECTFYLLAEKDAKGTNEKGVVQSQFVEMVRFKLPFDRDIKVWKIERDTFDVARKKGFDIEPQYKAWKATGIENPGTGTSLKDISILSRAQVEMFAAVGIHTLEQLSEINPDEIAAKYGPAAAEAQKVAKRWAKAADKVVDKLALVKKLESYEAENKMLRDQLAALRSKYEAATSNII